MSIPSATETKRGSRQSHLVLHLAIGAVVFALIFSFVVLSTLSEGRMFRGHSNRVVSLAFSSDGRRFLSGGLDGTIRLWDVATGKEVTKLIDINAWIYRVQLSEDQTEVYSVHGDGDVVVWSLGNKHQVSRFNVGGIMHVEHAALSDDARFLVCYNSNPGNDSGLWAWDLRKVSRIRRFGERQYVNKVNCVGISPDGKQVLSGEANEGNIRIWNVETGKQVRSLAGHWGGTYVAVFSPIGDQVLSFGADKVARLWDVETGREVSQIQGLSYPVKCIAISPDGDRAVFAGADSMVMLWDLCAGQKIRSYEGHKQWVFSVAFSPDGKGVISAGGLDDWYPHKFPEWPRPDNTIRYRNLPAKD
jgi:WD40 repeat protein